MKKSYFSNSNVILEPCDLIASGSERDCYIFRGNENLCIKVSHGRDREKRQNERDYKYYFNTLKNISDWSRLTECHGWVETNKGSGLVFDFVKDHDGSPSDTLDQYLKIYGLNHEVEKELVMLRRYLLENNIMVCDLRDRNIACQLRSEGLFLRLIDGVGNRDFIKFCDWSKTLGCRKIQRHWCKLEKLLRG